MRTLLSLCIAATLAPGLPGGLGPEGGHALASPSGQPLFPHLVGLPLPGWLTAFGSREMTTAYGGYYQRQELPGGATLAILRVQGLLGAYLVRSGRCIGDLVGEPIELPAPEATEAALRKRGFTSRHRFVATRKGDFALDAIAYEHVGGGLVERYVFTLHPGAPGDPRGTRKVLSEVGLYPVALRGALETLMPELDNGVASFFEQGQTSIPSGLRSCHNAMRMGRSFAGRVVFRADRRSPEPRAWSAASQFVIGTL